MNRGQFLGDASLEAVDRRAHNKTGSGRRKVMSARNDQHMLRMAVNDRAASYRQLAACWFTAAILLISASSIRRRLP